MFISRKLCLSSAVVTALALNAAAQKKDYTIAEATNGMATTLAPKGLSKPTWEPGTHKLYHTVKGKDNEAWVSVSFPRGNADTVFTLKELNEALGEKGKLKSIPAFTWLDNDVVYFTHKTEIKKGLRTAGGFNWTTLTRLPDNAENVTVDKSGNIAYTIANNLWMVNKDKQTYQLTSDANENIVNGQAVHRNEFGIQGGIFFSPRGNYLAYYRMDQTMVKDYPIINWSADPAKNNNIKYPMAGGTSHEVTLNVYNPTTGKTTTLRVDGPKDQYLTCVTWSPDEQYIFVGVLNRDQNHLVLNKYNAHTGAEVSTLFEEKHSKYVEPLNPLKFVPGSNDKFVWWSQRDGYMHLYLYRTNGELVRQLTKGKWVVNDIVGINRDAEELIITAAKESPLEKHIYTVGWDNGKIHRIDEGAGTHTAEVSEDGQYVLDVYSNATTPKKTLVRSTDGNYEKVLLNASNPLEDYFRPVVKNVKLKADDGTPLYGKLILPIDFDSTKKYPVVVYLYNGPHVQLIKNSFPACGNLWYEYLAQRGYIVFTMDGRGSGNRGQAFEQALFRKMGTVEVDDQLKGVDYLRSLPYADKDRMGIHGWSYGGFMTTTIMLKHPGIFKCAVAGGPVMDWKMYEVMYTERYMDAPQDNPKGYEQSALFDKVKNLKGKLMLIHGTDDNTVVWQHSINFLKKCVDENVQVDYFVYPGYEHNVRGKDRAHLMQKITDYFDLYLKPELNRKATL